MRHITKGKEPESLTRHRATPGASYEGYQEKGELRKALLREQGHLCCYCMQRISAERMRIEHWEPQRGEDGNPERDLTYANLLGACQGGERTREERGEDRARPRRFQHRPAERPGDEPVHAYHHCDVHKHDTLITVHPANPARSCETLVKYLADGEITSDDAVIRKDLSGTLNLNLGWLKKNRKRVIDTTLDCLKAKHPRGDWPADLLEREITRRKTVNAQGMLDEYCQVAIYFLQKRLKRKK